MPDRKYYESVKQAGDELTRAVKLTIEAGKQISDEAWVQDRNKILDLLNKINTGLSVVTDMYVMQGLQNLNDSERPSGGGMKFRD